jgi:hypothetical protein
VELTPPGIRSRRGSGHEDGAGVGPALADRQGMRLADLPDPARALVAAFASPWLPEVAMAGSAFLGSHSGIQRTGVVSPGRLPSRAETRSAACSTASRRMN